MTEKRLRLSWVPKLGSRPLGQSIPLIVVGAKSAGVHAPTCKSNVSIWLGAPGIRKKMQFLAVPIIVAPGVVVITCAETGIGETKYPATPVAAILKKTRLSMIEFIDLIIEKEVDLVQQEPLQGFRSRAVSLLLKHRC